MQWSAIINIAYIKRIFVERPRLSVVFWVAFVFVYVVGTLAVLAIVLPDLTAVFEGKNGSQEIAIKLTTIRVSVIVVSMITFPILLWNKSKYSLIFVKIVTAWAICMYIDDHLILYDVLQYPELDLVKIVFALRPFAITALAWICLELDFRAKNGY